MDYLSAQSIRLTWTGVIGRVAWIALNGVLKHGPLFFDGTARTFDLNVTDPFRVEIHETATTEAANAIGERFVRRPLIWWSALAGAITYVVYRRPRAAEAETIIATQRHDAGRFHYELRPIPDLRGDGGIWNSFRVEAQNAREAESVGAEKPMFVAGLPAKPVSVAAAGAAGVFTLTLGV